MKTFEEARAEISTMPKAKVYWLVRNANHPAYRSAAKSLVSEWEEKENKPLTPLEKWDNIPT